MKIQEIIEAAPAKVTKVVQGVSAEIDNGDGTKTIVDLKKNPGALTKDPKTGKVGMNQQQNAKPGTKTAIKPGDKVATNAGTGNPKQSRSF